MWDVMERLAASESVWEIVTGRFVPDEYIPLFSPEEWEEIDEIRENAVRPDYDDKYPF